MRLRPVENNCAGLAAALAGADTAAVVTAHDGTLTLDSVGPISPWLPVGASLPVEEFLGAGARQAIALLLSSEIPWLDCRPPRGFRSAALLATPGPSVSPQLVLVLSAKRRLDQYRLDAAAAQLGDRRRPCSGVSVEHGIAA